MVIPSGKSRLLGRAALFVVVDLLEIGVDHLVVMPRVRTTAGAGAWSARSGMRSTLRPGAAGVLRRLVHRYAELHRDLGQGFGLRLDLLDIVAADDILQRLDR